MKMAISLALLVVTLIGLQPLVAADSAREMGNCTDLILALSPCLPKMDSPICCQRLGDLASSGNISEDCFCYLVQNPTLGVRLDRLQSASLNSICRMNNIKNRKIKQIKPSDYLLALCKGSQNFGEKTMVLILVFIVTLMALLPFGSTAIYMILYCTVVPQKVPYFTIASMLSFVLATWHGIMLNDEQSSKISILNGIRAGLELAKIVSTIYRNRRLLMPTVKSFTLAVLFAVIFGTLQFVLEGKTKLDFFAYSSTCFSIIMLIVPLFTLREEARIQPKKWFASINAFGQTIPRLLSTLAGASAGDIPSSVTGGVGFMISLGATLWLGSIQLQELELEEKERQVAVRQKRQVAVRQGRQFAVRLGRTQSCKYF